MKLLLITGYKLKMMFSDGLFFAAMIILPLFITLATGYALRYEKLNTIPAAFVDDDNSRTSQLLLERLQKKEGLSVSRVSRREALEMLKANKVEAAFIIKKGFERKIKEEDSGECIDVVKSPASFSSAYIGEIVAGEVMRFSADSMALNRVAGLQERQGKTMGESLSREVQEFIDSQWEPKPLMTIDYRELEGNQAGKVERVSLPAATATSAGIVVVFILFYTLFNSSWLIEERTNGTLKRLVSGPGALGTVFAGNLLALMLAGMTQIFLFAAINKVIFGVELFPGVWAYVLFLSYLAAVTSISLLLSSLLKTPAQLQAGAPVFALLTGFAGGCFWNFVEMSPAVKQLALLTPQGWALEGINRLLVNSGDAAAVIVPVCVLSGLALILLPVSYCFTSRSVR